MGAKGKDNGGIYQFGIPRAETVSEDGMPVPPRDGLGDRHQFPADRRRQGGDHRRFRADREEVNPVMKALREHGIEVTALHSHMLDEQPRLFFMHFWAMTMRRNWRRGSARRSTRRTSRKAEAWPPLQGRVSC